MKTLKNTQTFVQLLSTLSTITKTTSNSTKGDIKEGVVLRNVDWSPGRGKDIYYSIKNNLPYSIYNIKMIFIVYDKTGTVVDYDEIDYCGWEPIKPFLAKSFTWSTGWLPEVSLINASKVEARILDYEIVED